jgi:alpha-L-rhamnosidase
VIGATKTKRRINDLRIIVPHKEYKLLKAALLFCSLCSGRLLATERLPLGQLDPARDIKQPRLESAMHQPLPEQYIWTAGDAAALQKDNARYLFAGPTVKAEAHYFRTRFSVAKVPREATLYIAGPRSAKVYLNGQLVDDVASDIASPLGMHVFTTDIVRSLKQGENVLALEVVRGRGIPGVSNNPLVRQQTFGEVLVAKIVPATKGISRIPILMSGPGWKSSTLHAEGWQLPEFNDAAWPAVQTLGAIESS